MFVHPRILEVLEQIIDRIDNESNGEIKAKVLSTNRTPQEQFELFKKGREFRNGNWVKIRGGRHVTNIDGFSKMSRHNYLPSLACDFGLFRGGKYLLDDASYNIIGLAAKDAGLNWGGDWRSFKDKPHVQLNKNQMFKSSFIKDVALQWQRYLKMSGSYTDSLDGIFGKNSKKALKEVTGFDGQSPEAWKSLFRQFGPLTSND